ncbi:MAG TPA: hypothetical protein VM144_00170 [Aestuariivirga sp.]|nr:hypothetical protein [Aestuariivirga sp.]
MYCTNSNLNVAKHSLTTLVAAAALSISASVALASNMEKVDIVPEGIDLNPIYVNSNSSGYTGSENKSHKYMVRVFAKAKGQNRVWKVSIFGIGKGILFSKDVGKSEGWPVYGKSHEVHAKPSSLSWLTTPKTACDKMLQEKVAGGMSKADVLKNDRKTTAAAFVAFSASADSKAHNKDNKHVTSDGSFGHNDNVIYKVPVVCRAAL